MELIKPSIELWEQPKDKLGIFEHIERCLRLCYKSGHLTKLDPETRRSLTAIDYCYRVLEVSKHSSAGENSALYATVPEKDWYSNSVQSVGCWVRELELSKPYTRINKVGETYYVTTNYRVVLQHGLQEFFNQYGVEEPTKYHSRRITTKWVCTRACANQLVRHRIFSFTQTSQRYVNYAKKGGMAFIIPHWSVAQPGVVEHFGPRTLDYANGFKIQASDAELLFYKTLAEDEQTYRRLIESGGFKAEDARDILPNATMTELVMSCYVEDLIRPEGFFDLRTDPHAQAEIRGLALDLKHQLIEKGWISK